MRLTDDDTKDERIQVRCTKDTLYRFKEFASLYTTQEQAIRDLLDTYEEYPSLFSRRSGPE